LLAIIGYLFYQNNASMMSNAMRFEMLYQARMIESKLMMAEERGEENLSTKLLKNLHPVRFKVGFFDESHKALYSEIHEPLQFDKSFYTSATHCYSVVKYPSDRLEVGYIILREDELKTNLHHLRWRIIYYLIGLFLFMAIVGFFLSKLFLKPVRDKIEALDRFIEDTTHELNTPVSAILMTIQSLEGIEPKKHNRLKASAQRLSTMYDTLSYSLSQETELSPKEPFAMDTLLMERVETMRPLAESKYIDVCTTLSSCMLMANKENMRRVIDNILSNAIKYSNPHGKITIVLESNGMKICDEGIGISQADQEDIFKRYRRFNKERGGFGIGLSIVMDICRDNGIEVAINSKKGKGSCFSLDLSRLVVST
jgi:two-component system OmpR family sensor kinase